MFHNRTGFRAALVVTGLTLSTPALAGPDLQVTGALLADAELLPGESVSASCTIVNAGDAQANISQLRYYFSADNVYDSADTYLNYDSVDALLVGASNAESANVKVPSGTTDGYYFILFVADYKNEVIESNESNNVASVAITVGAPTPPAEDPDLVVSSYTVDRTSVHPDEQVATTTAVANIGSEGAGASYLKYFLSQDAVWDSYDKQISYDKVDALAAGATGAEDALLRISKATVGGNYYLLFVADAAGEVTEQDETNNVRAQPLTVTADLVGADLPDLVVENAALGLSSLKAGEKLPVSATVKNAGPATATIASRLKYFLSTDTTWDGADKYLNYDNVGTLTSLQTSPEDASLTLPTTVVDGDYYILFVADATSEVAEQYESNNVVALPFKIGAEPPPPEEEVKDLPDLLATDVSLVKNELIPGESTVLKAGVLNAGAAAAPISRMRYYYSVDSTYETSDKYLGYDNVDALAVDQVGLEDANVRVPSDAIDGTSYFLVIVDSSAEVAESDETNNVYPQPVSVIADDPTADKPDLALSDLAASKATVGVGNTVFVSVFISNNGVQPAPGSRLKFYLSTDTTWSSTDSYIEYCLTPAIDVGGKVIVGADIRIPYLTATGPRYIIVVADVNKEVDERIESNNTASVAVTIGTDEGPADVYPYDCDAVTTDSSILASNTIATYNTLHLGWENSKDFHGMACVISHFDLIGLVEIDNPQGVADLEAEVEALTGEGWSTHTSDHSVGEGSRYEYYSYIWRDEKVTFVEALGFFDDPLDNIKRDPYGATFRMGLADFSLVMFHLRYGSVLADRRYEAQYLDDVYTYFQAKNGAEQDVLIGGDFNLAGNDSAFDIGAVDGITYITDPQQGTSLDASGLTSSFDNIFYPRTYFSEYDYSGAFDYTLGNYAEYKNTISDHIPVWLALWTTLDDD